MALQSLYQQRSGGESDVGSALVLDTWWNGENEENEKLSL